VKRPGRRLTADEAALWARVAKTVNPIEGRQNLPRDRKEDPREAVVEGARLPKPRPTAGPLHQPAAGPPPRSGEDLRPRSHHGLDAGWDRRLARGLVPPDFTLDLHGATLDAAHARLEHGLALALAQGARLVLLITGRERPSDDRRSRGVIRRKFMDWLAAGPHASRIAAIRPAHPRHGGAGAVYIVLRRAR
jgi:DNA-nicking Smr family endonuclease